jgi:hypothetical protein
MSRRGCSLPANASGVDPHRASISSRFGQASSRSSASAAAPARRRCCVSGPGSILCLHACIDSVGSIGCLGLGSSCAHDSHTVMKRRTTCDLMERALVAAGIWKHQIRAPSTSLIRSSGSSCATTTVDSLPASCDRGWARPAAGSINLLACVCTHTGVKSDRYQRWAAPLFPAPVRTAGAV